MLGDVRFLDLWLTDVQGIEPWEGAGGGVWRDLDLSVLKRRFRVEQRVEFGFVRFGHGTGDGVSILGIES